MQPEIPGPSWGVYISPDHAEAVGRASDYMFFAAEIAEGHGDHEAARLLEGDAAEVADEYRRLTELAESRS